MSVIGPDRSRQNIHERAAIVIGARLDNAYENHGFDIPGLAAAVSLASVVTHSSGCTCARVTGAFGLISRAAQVSVRNLSDGVILVRFNDATADPITVYPNDPMYWTFTEVTAIYLSNPSASPRAVAIALG